MFIVSVGHILELQISSKQVHRIDSDIARYLTIFYNVHIDLLIIHHMKSYDIQYSLQHL